MKIIVAGFSKTGTKTMNAALTALGYSVYDYEDNFYCLRNDWIKICNVGGTREDFYRMYKDVDATCDIPACVFWEEILEAFPDAKIIFMKRKSEEDWLRSWQRQAKSIEENYLLTTLTFFSPEAYSLFHYSRHVGRIVFGTPPQAFWKTYRGISSTVAKKRYRDHNISVMERAPKDKLLVFSMSDGWEPLCDFLGQPVPQIPFPHKNQRGSLVDDYLKHSPVFIRMKKEMAITLSLTVLLGGVGAYVFYKYPTWFSRLKFW